MKVCKRERKEKRNEIRNTSCSRNWSENRALATEEAKSLDLVDSVEIKMRGHDEVKITIHADCRKAWEMVVNYGLKISQIEGDGGSTVSRIIEIESKSEIDFEHIHVNTKKIENNRIVNNGRNMALEFDKLVEEEKLKCVSEDRKTHS